MAGPLKNSKHEKFAQLIVKGVTQTFAYQKATGSKCNAATGAVEGSKLIRKPEIRARIDELNEKAAASVVITKKHIIDLLYKNGTAAMIEGQRGPANRAFELIGKENRMFIDRKNVTVRSLNELSEEELQAVIDESGGTPPSDEEEAEGRGDS